MSGPSFPILMYHQVGVPSPRGTPSRSLCVTTADFRAQMRWLKRLGYHGVSMRDLMPYLAGEKRGKAVGITFDDGYANVFANALPVLQDVGFTATNYFVAREIGGFNRWDQGKGIPRSDCMTRAQLLEWASLGHEVGSHTLNHPQLPLVCAEEARREIFDARRELQDMTGSDISAFCYPHGGVNPAIRQMVEDAGHTNATTVRRGRARANDDPLMLPRVTVRRGYGWMHLMAKILTAR